MAFLLLPGPQGFIPQLGLHSSFQGHAAQSNTRDRSTGLGAKLSHLHTAHASSQCSPGLLHGRALGSVLATLTPLLEGGGSPSTHLTVSGGRRGHPPRRTSLRRDAGTRPSHLAVRLLPAKEQSLTKGTDGNGPTLLGHAWPQAVCPSPPLQSLLHPAQSQKYKDRL